MAGYEKEVKAGWKTSEFWVTLLAIVAGLAAHLGFLSPEEAANVEGEGASIIVKVFELLALVGPAVAYTYVRGIVKRG